ncbi:glycosyltransferase family 87 protein [Luteococcus peritonei]|uniref:Glycosyltransferase family 87 protein n=1 Tax=Luteococcus peritonei TaxID=88874 RepID=A0ABW4RSE5_9ACTN
MASTQHQGRDAHAVAREWAAATAFALSVYYCWAVTSGLANLDGPGGEHGFDFRDTVWMPLRDFLAGGVPWDVDYYLTKFPYAQNFPLYTPSYWWFMAPFLVMPYRLGAGAWAVLAVYALVWLVHRSLRLIAPRLLAEQPWLVAVGSVVLCMTRPGRAGILSCNWAVFCAVAAGVLLMPIVRRWAVVGLVMTALVKPQAGLAALVEQVVLRRGRQVATAVGLSVLLSLPIGIITLVRLGGLDRAMEVLRKVLAVGDGPGTGPGEHSSTRIDLYGTVGHVIGSAPPGWVALLCLLVSGALTLGVQAWAVRRVAWSDPWFLLAGGLGLCLVLPNQIYSVPVLVPALVALVLAFWRADEWRGRLLPGLALALLAVPFANTGPAFSILGMDNRQANIVTGLALFAAAVLAAVQLLRGRGLPAVRGEGWPATREPVVVHARPAVLPAEHPEVQPVVDPEETVSPEIAAAESDEQSLARDLLGPVRAVKAEKGRPYGLDERSHLVAALVLVRSDRRVRAEGIAKVAIGEVEARKLPNRTLRLRA